MPAIPSLSNIAAAMTRRWAKALRLVAEGKVHETSVPGAFLVEGDSGEWHPDLNTNTCDCPDHDNRHCFCCHMLAGVIMSAHLFASEVTAQNALLTTDFTSAGFAALAIGRYEFRAKELLR